MKKILMAVIGVAVLAFGAMAINSPVFAENDLTKKACQDADAEQKSALGCDKNQQAPEVVTNIFNGVLTVVGILAVLIIVVAGQRYVTSSGDPAKVQQAKNMILYGVIGLIVALLAFAVVNFVLSGVFS